MSNTADAIIIGAGVIGAAVAFERAKRGLRTLTVDRNKLAGHGFTASFITLLAYPATSRVQVRPNLGFIRQFCFD